MRETLSTADDLSVVDTSVECDQHRPDNCPRCGPWAQRRVASVVRAGGSRGLSLRTALDLLGNSPTTPIGPALMRMIRSGQVELTADRLLVWRGQP